MECPREGGTGRPKGRRPPRAAGHPEAHRSPSTGGGLAPLPPTPAFSSVAIALVWLRAPGWEALGHR